MTHIRKTQSPLILTLQVTPRHHDDIAFEAYDLDNERFYRHLVIDRDTWNDLGQPVTVTVTIEPGDVLNV